MRSLWLLLLVVVGFLVSVTSCKRKKKESYCFVEAISVEVLGTVKDPYQSLPYRLHVTVGGQAVSVDKNGNFSTVVDLAGKAGEADVEVADEAVPENNTRKRIVEH